MSEQIYFPGTETVGAPGAPGQPPVLATPHAGYWERKYKNLLPIVEVVVEGDPRSDDFTTQCIDDDLAERILNELVQSNMAWVEERASELLRNARKKDADEAAEDKAPYNYEVYRK